MQSIIIVIKTLRNERLQTSWKQFNWHDFYNCSFFWNSCSNVVLKDLSLKVWKISWKTVRNVQDVLTIGIYLHWVFNIYPTNCLLSWKHKLFNLYTQPSQSQFSIFFLCLFDDVLKMMKDKKKITFFSLYKKSSFLFCC